MHILMFDSVYSVILLKSSIMYTQIKVLWFMMTYAVFIKLYMHVQDGKQHNPHNTPRKLTTAKILCLDHPRV